MIVNHYIYILAIIITIQIVYLIELSPVEDNVIIATETKIRDILNKIVQLFNIESDTEALIKLYYEVHDKLLATSLQSADNWIKVVKLATVDVPGDMVEIVKVVVNEITNYSDTPNEPVYEDKMIQLIDAFLQELEFTNSVYGGDVNIQSLIQNMLMWKRTHSDEVYQDIDDESDIESDSNEIWTPKESFLNNSRRIFEGRRTTTKLFPFVAAIYLFEQFHCAGAVISSDIIITAASGVQLIYNNRFFRENPSMIDVRVGSSFHALGGELIKVIYVYFHPSYNPATLKDNLCLLRLIRHIKFQAKSKRVKKIVFDKNEAALPINIPEIVILGWGSKGHGNKIQLEGALSYARLSVYALSECQVIYSKRFITEKNFCAGFISKGGGACNQDVGDPAIFGGILYGIVSFGAPVCGAADSPTVFTKLGYYSDWIETIIEENVPVRKARTSTTMYVVYIDNSTTTTRAPILIQTQSSASAPIKRQPDQDEISDQESSEHLKLKESLNKPQKVHLSHSKTKHHKQHGKSYQKTSLVPYYSNEKDSEQETTKNHHHHHHHHHHKQKKSKKTKHPKHTTTQKKPKKIYITGVYDDSDSETTTYFTRTTSKHWKTTTQYITTTVQHTTTATQQTRTTRQNTTTIRQHILSQRQHVHPPPKQSNHDVPLISKYKLRDLLRPFGHIETIKKHIHDKQYFTTKPKMRDYVNDTAKYNTNKMEDDKNVKKRQSYEDAQYEKNDKSFQVILKFTEPPKTTIYKKKYVYADEEMSISHLLNKSRLHKNPVSSSQRITPFYTSYPPKHSKHGNQHHDSEYYYDEEEDDRNPKNQYLNDKPVPSYDDKFSHANDNDFESADLYENYENLANKNYYLQKKLIKAKSSHQINDQKSPKKLEYSDYDSLEDKYGVVKPDKMYQKYLYNVEGHIEQTPKPKAMQINDVKKEKSPKLIIDPDNYYYDEFEPKNKQISLSNVSTYSDYDELEQAYNDYQESNLHIASKSVEDKTVKSKQISYQQRSKLSTENEKLNSNELKTILKQVINLPESIDKAELLQELFETQKHLSSDPGKGSEG